MNVRTFLLVFMGAFFPWVGKLGVWGRSVPQRGPRDGAPVGSGVEASESRRQVMKIVHQFIRLLSVLQCTKHFTTFPDGGHVPPLAHACVSPCSCWCSSAYSLKCH